MNGIPINYLSRWLGHSSIQTTLIYLEDGAVTQSMTSCAFGYNISYLLLVNDLVPVVAVQHKCQCK